MRLLSVVTRTGLYAIQKTEPLTDVITSLAARPALGVVGMGTRIQGYPPEGPDWKRVPTSLFGVSPYNRICELRCKRSGLAPRLGSGWYLGDGSIRTAAHNLDDVYLVQVRFPGSNAFIETSEFEINSGYFDDNNVPRPCSQNDLATITIKATDNLVLSDVFELPDDVDAYRVIGFVDGQLVEDVGIGKLAGPFVTYETHTDEGHSGCPVFHKNDLVGVHVGLSYAAAKYFAPGNEPVTWLRNCAISL